MKSYNNSDADYLITFYSKKMIGEFIDKERKYKINGFAKEDDTPEKCSVVAMADTKMETLKLKREISSMAKILNLDSPEDALKHRDQ